MRFDLTRRATLLGALLATAGLAALPAVAQAQAWPSKPIRLIVGFAPGGGTDIVARALAPKMSEILGRRWSSRTGPAPPARSRPKWSRSRRPTATRSWSATRTRTRSRRSCTPRRRTTRPQRLHADHLHRLRAERAGRQSGGRRQDRGELIALAKAEPSKLTYASSGVGSTQHLAGELFARSRTSGSSTSRTRAAARRSSTCSPTRST